MKLLKAIRISVCFLVLALIFASGVLAQMEWTKHGKVKTIRETGIIEDGLLGLPGEWDQSEVGYCCVIYDDSLYKMWYTGFPSYKIGYATSIDGKNWVKHGPVSEEKSPGTVPDCNGLRGDPDDWDSSGAGTPAVVLDGSILHMFYTGARSGQGGRIGYATSEYNPAKPDDFGRVWIKQNDDQPVLKPRSECSECDCQEEDECWDSSSIGTGSVVLGTEPGEPKFKMWYYGRNSNLDTGIGYATSENGEFWNYRCNVSILEPGTNAPYDSSGVGAPYVIDNGSGSSPRYEMWYHGHDSTNERICYATSDDPEGPWIGPNLYALDVGPEAWDSRHVSRPAVIPDDEEYKMWYSGVPGHMIGYATKSIPDNIGPIVLNFEAAPNPVVVNNPVELTAIVDDSTTGSGNITSAEYKVEDNAGNIVIDWSDMMASDNAFDEVTEEVEGIITGLNMPGTYKVWVRGTDSAGNTGNGISITLTVIPLPAVVDIDPDTLNLKAKGRWITCYIELPEEYDVSIIDVDTILLERVMEAQRSNVQGDVLMVKFDRRELINYLDGVTGYITLTVTGEVDGNIPFEGSDIIRVIKPGKAPVASHEFALLQNYPNAFNPETWIPYRLAEGVDVSIKVFDISGRLVRSLNLGHRPAGFYVSRDKAAYWDGRNEAGEYVSSGVYFYRIQAGEYTATRKMIARK